MQKLMSIPQLLTEILGGGRIGPPLVVGRPKKVGGNRVKLSWKVHDIDIERRLDNSPNAFSKVHLESLFSQIYVYLFRPTFLSPCEMEFKGGG